MMIRAFRLAAIFILAVKYHAVSSYDCQAKYGSPLSFDDKPTGEELAQKLVGTGIRIVDNSVELKQGTCDKQGGSGGTGAGSGPGAGGGLSFLLLFSLFFPPSFSFFPPFSPFFSLSPLTSRFFTLGYVLTSTPFRARTLLHNLV